MPEIVDTQNAARGSAEWWLVRLERRLAERAITMALHDDYYHGRHRMTLHTARILKAFGKEFKDVRSNYCSVVVDALAERLHLQAFLFDSQDEPNKEAWEIWQANGLDAAFARGMRSGLIKGESSLIVWADADGEPTITIEDGAEVYVALNPADPRERRAALKLWFDLDEARSYATVYLPDGIHKYESTRADDLLRDPAGRFLTRRSNVWTRRIVEGEEWPLPNPLGVVPVIPIPNKPDAAGVGESEIAQIEPIQDAINANLVNILLAGQFSAFRQKFASNVRLEVDKATGKVKEPWQISVDTIITAPPPAPGEQPVQFGEFEQTELGGYVGVHEALVQAISTISRTPPHYFLGQQGVFPSGEALRAVEAGLTFKARDRIRDDSEPIEEVMRLAFAVKARQSGLSAAAKTRYEKWAAMKSAAADWKDPETRAESEHVDALGKVAAMLGVPKRALWPRIPASPQEIARWTEMAKEEAAAAAQPQPEPPDELVIDDGTGSPPVVVRKRPPTPPGGPPA